MIYIIKSHKPIGNLNNKYGIAQLYLGSTDNVERRLEEHQAGRGAKITAAMVKAGNNLEVVMVLPGCRKVERYLKNVLKNNRRLYERYLNGSLVAQWTAICQKAVDWYDNVYTIQFSRSLK